jgi:hypothetical protein
MKIFKLLITFCLATLFLTGHTQTATSIADGNWTSPFTWNCTCVPTPGYTVIINNNVILNTSFSLPSGGITVNAGASLIEEATPRDIMISGGSLVNNGTTQFRFLLAQSGSVSNTDTLRLKSFASYVSFTNSGSILQLDSFYNAGIFSNTGLVEASKFFNQDSLLNTGTFTGVDSFFNNGSLRNAGSITTPTFFNNTTLYNDGLITGVDSMTNAGYFLNSNTATLNADSLWNYSNFINDGAITNIAFLNTGSLTNNGHMAFKDASNLGNLTNSDTMQGSHSISNAGQFNNASGAQLLLGGSFANSNAISHNAVFIDNGTVRADSNWLNTDTVRGTSGKFIVQFETSNTGEMLGSFDFCDLTPPPTAPFIDFNSGTISANITWCSPTAGISEPGRDAGSVFNFQVNSPVFNNNLSLQFNLNQPADVLWRICDISGKVLLTGKALNVLSASEQIGVATLASGIYLVTASAGNEVITRRFAKF